MKEQYPDTILFFRLGDFYEMFGKDAVETSRLLSITLTARSKGENSIPMCGVPYHAATGYIAKLTRLGKKVAICEQLSDPNLPGIVQRDVVRIITPGTTLDDNVLEQKSNNFVMAIIAKGETFDLAYADISTGEFKKTVCTNEQELSCEIERLLPTEIIAPVTLMKTAAIVRIRGTHPQIFFFEIDTENTNYTDAETALTAYLLQNQKSRLDHLDEAQPYEINEFMPLDEATLKNLELVTTLRENKKEGTLLWVIDETITAMGGRLIRYFLTHPLRCKSEIEGRLEAVEELKTKVRLLDSLRGELKNVMDLERLVARLSLNQGNARDLNALKNSLRTVPLIQTNISQCKSPLLQKILLKIDPITDLAELIEKAIVPEPPLAITDGGMIAQGFNHELDELKVISKEGKSFIQALQQQEITKTGINTLKVRYNNVFGYYIEVSKGSVKNVPEHYIRKQTLVNAERYITPELKVFEEKILGAEEKIVALEHRIFCNLRERVVQEIKRIQHTARSLALLDVLASMATVAIQCNYCKPIINESGKIEINDGRHPVVEKMTFNGRFIPNDTFLEQEGDRLMLITGPNMGGKSTYLRQVALITLLAQIGSFVPAKSAEIGIVDRIFTRVGASDNLVRGQSTFMVEMQETAYILQNATQNSLIILDEIGRGTSTYDGMSLAWAIMEYLHNEIKAKTLFATHYHELIALADKLSHAINYSVAVKEENDGIIFLYRIQSGGVNRSYGIEVAKLAGLPVTVISKANQILIDLEEGVLEPGIRHELETITDKEAQTALFIDSALHERTHNQIREITAIDLNNLTPMQAMQKLSEIKDKFQKL